MRSAHLKTDEMMLPAEFIETLGPSQEEERNTISASYYERRDNVYFAIAIEDGATLLVFVMYVLYHLISKLRGNEKNVHMNNLGVALALLGVAMYSVWFSFEVVRTLNNNWYVHHETLFNWILWTADSAYLLYHWFFNWRYVKSTFRLPVLQKSAEFHSEKLDKILNQREEQDVIFSPKKLEDHETVMVELKITQRK